MVYDREGRTMMNEGNDDNLCRALWSMYSCLQETVAKIDQESGVNVLAVIPWRTLLANGEILNLPMSILLESLTLSFCLLRSNS